MIRILKTPLISGILSVFFAASVFCFNAKADVANKPTAEHLAAARQAIEALKVTDQFDVILPEISRALKIQLTSINPNLSSKISSTVDKETLAISAKRADLETRAAEVYAQYFTKDELEQITQFYQGPVGKKLMQQAPQIIDSLLKNVDLWRQSIAQDLAQKVKKQLGLNAKTPALPSKAKKQ